MLKRHLSSLLVLLALVATAVAANPTGVVRAVNGDLVTIENNGDALPAVGDKAEIFFQLAGTDSEVSVATGRVQESAPGKIIVKIEKTSGTVEADQLARFITAGSQNPNATSAPASSPAVTNAQSSPAVTSPSSSSGAMSEDQVRAALTGKWSAKSPDGLRGTVIFQADGTVVVPLEGRIGTQGGFVRGKYTIDAASTPPRVVITKIEVMPSPLFTPEELKDFQGGLERLRQYQPLPGDRTLDRFLSQPVKEALLRSTWIGELDADAHIKIQGFTEAEAATRPQLGPQAASLRKLGPYAKGPPADFYAPGTAPEDRAEASPTPFMTPPGSPEYVAAVRKAWELHQEYEAIEKKLDSPATTATERAELERRRKEVIAGLEKNNAERIQLHENEDRKFAAGRKAYDDAVTRFQQGDYDGAIANFTTAIDSGQRTQFTFYNRALCYTKKKDWRKALEDLNEALAIQADYDTAISMRALVRINMGDFQPALLEDCNKALSLLTPNTRNNPTIAQLYLRRGVYYAHEGATKLAEDDWKKAIEMDPSVEKYVQNARATYSGAKKQTPRRKR